MLLLIIVKKFDFFSATYFRYFQCIKNYVAFLFIKFFYIYLQCFLIIYKYTIEIVQIIIIVKLK